MSHIEMMKNKLTEEVNLFWGATWRLGSSQVKFKVPRAS